MNKISKQLIKIAKLIQAEVQVDQTEHRIDQLCQWIKNGFKDKLYKVLNKLGLDVKEINQFVKNAQYKKIYNSWDGVYYLDGINDIEFRKTFVIPFKMELKDIVQKTAQDKNIFVQVTNNRDKQLFFSFKLTLVAKDWYPLFRSCKEFNYDEKTGVLDKDSLKELQSKLKSCFNDLKF